jgi:hypothetical protein
MDIVPPGDRGFGNSKDFGGNGVTMAVGRTLHTGRHGAGGPTALTPVPLN